MYINEKIYDASNHENGSSFFNYLKWLFTVPVRFRFQETKKKTVPIRFRFQKVGSGSVPVPEGRFRFGSGFKKLKKIGSGSVSVPKGRFRFGFRFHFFWNRRTLSDGGVSTWVMVNYLKTLLAIIFMIVIMGISGVYNFIVKLAFYLNLKT
jgi:hypothetical protein